MSEQQDRWGPGWAVFMTQNFDRPYSDALARAMELARARGAAATTGFLSWSELAAALEDPEVWSTLTLEHGEATAKHVRGACQGAVAARRGAP